MKEKIFALTVSSPEELKANKSVLLEYGKDNSAFVVLGIDGPQLLVRPFYLTNVRYGEIENHLQQEVVDLLSLPAADINFDFQFLSKKDNKTFGIFICLPKKALQEYISILDNTKLTALKVTASSLAAIDSFFEHRKGNHERFCLLGFLKQQRINLTVFNNRECELLREIPYGELQEAAEEIARSLKSLGGSTKAIERIYFYGETSQKEELVKDVARQFGIGAEEVNFIDLKKGLCSSKSYFSLNLLRHYSFALSRRYQILTLINIFLFLCLPVLLFLSFKIYSQEKMIQDFKSSFSRADYEYAKTLEQEVKADAQHIKK